MNMSVPSSRGTKVKGQSTEYCVEVIVSGRLTQTWLRYSELRDLSQRLKTIKGNKLNFKVSFFVIWVIKTFSKKKHLRDS